MTKIETRNYLKAWRIRNRDKVKIYSKTRYEKFRAHDLANKRKYYEENRVKILDYGKKRHQKLKNNTEYRSQRNSYFMAYYYANHSERREYFRKRNLSIKREVLTQYGGGILRCCWNDCDVSDIDMLTLDHIDNSGAIERKLNGGSSLHCGFKLYAKLKRQQFPSGFQTLCWNHQMKKELVRKRLKYEST